MAELLPLTATNVFHSSPTLRKTECSKHTECNQKHSHLIVREHFAKCVPPITQSELQLWNDRFCSRVLLYHCESTKDSFDACEMLQCGWTALALAARHGKVEAVELLLRWIKNSGLLPREVKHAQISKVADYSECILPLTENVFKAPCPRSFR